MPVGLPCGPAACLILCHLTPQALQTAKPVVDAGNSLTALVRQMFTEGEED